MRQRHEWIEFGIVATDTAIRQIERHDLEPTDPTVDAITRIRHKCDTLADRANEKPRQLAGTIHLHPSGRYVYVANRADHTVDFRGRKVFGGGENSIAVFAIDAVSGEPRLIQHADAHAYHVRTFAFDPSGRLMVAASIKPMALRDGDEVRFGNTVMHFHSS